MDHFYKVMRAMGQWQMLDEPSPKVISALVCSSTCLAVHVKERRWHVVRQKRCEQWRHCGQPAQVGKATRCWADLLAQEFRANGSTQLLVRGKDATLGHFVDHQINEPKWEAWKVLPEAVRTGQVAFALAHDGMDMHQVRDSVRLTAAAAQPAQASMLVYIGAAIRPGRAFSVNFSRRASL